MRSFSRRLAIAASLSVGLLALGLSACGGGNTAVTADDMSLGDASAPVTVIEYASVSCSHCARWNKDVFPAFKAKYIDTGKVHYVFREFITEPRQLAAAGFLLARCTGKDKYFSTLDQVFHAQDEIFQTGDIRGPLVAIAGQAGMSEQQFDACLAGTKEDAEINKVAQDGQDRYRISGTPTVIINGQPQPGVSHWDEIKPLIEAALAR